jgi:hypothetical protein
MPPVFLSPLVVTAPNVLFGKQLCCFVLVLKKDSGYAAISDCGPCIALGYPRASANSRCVGHAIQIPYSSLRTVDLAPSPFLSHPPRR